MDDNDTRGQGGLQVCGSLDQYGLGSGCCSVAQAHLGCATEPMRFAWAAVTLVGKLHRWPDRMELYRLGTHVDDHYGRQLARCSALGPGWPEEQAVICLVSRSPP